MSELFDLCDSDDEDWQMHPARDSATNLKQRRCGQSLTRKRRHIVSITSPTVAAAVAIVVDSDEESEHMQNNMRKRKMSDKKGGRSQMKRMPQNAFEILDLVDDRKMPALVTGITSDSLYSTQSKFPLSQKVIQLNHTPIMQIYEVFPDVDEDHAKMLLMQNGREEVAAVLSIMAEKGYQKSKSKGSIHKSGVTVHKQGAPIWAYNFMSAGSFEPTNLYEREAVQQLAIDFPFLSMFGAVQFIKMNRHYAICHETICNLVTGRTGTASSDMETQYKEYSALIKALRSGSLQEEQLRRFYSPSKSRQIIKKRYCAKLTTHVVTDLILLEEIKYVQHKMNIMTNRMESYKARMNAREIAERTNSTVDCLCCYTPVAIDEMIHCQNEGHLFCVDCLRRFAEEQIFGAGNLGINRATKEAATEIMCMFEDGCPSGFSVESLQKALPEKSLAKYNELQFHAAIEKACMDDLITCPKCDFQAVLPLTEMVFRCPVEECGFESCRKCREEAHIPLRCEEVEKKAETMGRLQVEEAISAAKIRTCPRPKCTKKFVKESGCNKMSCPCGAIVCYICRKEIAGYQHFCQIAHCTHSDCKKCVLYSKTEEDDARAMREAGERAAERIREATVLKPGQTNETNVNVDTILKGPLPPQGRPPGFRIPNYFLPVGVSDARVVDQARVSQLQAHISRIKNHSARRAINAQRHVRP